MTRPHRIASLLSSATEILYGLGLGDSVVAVSHECDYPPEVASKPRVTRSNIDSSKPSAAIDDEVQQRMRAGMALYTIDEKALISLAPTLIVTQTQCDVCAVRYEDVVDLKRRCEKLRLTEILALNPMSLEEVFADIARIAAATDRDDAAREYIDSLRRRVDHVRSRTADLPAERRPRVACVEWLDPPMIAANWMPELVRWAGGTPPNEGGQHSQYTTWQAIAEFEPEVVLLMPCGFDAPRALDEARALLATPQWRQVAASSRGRAYAIDGNAYFNRSGPRLVDSLELLATLLHPELFPELADRPDFRHARAALAGVD